MEYKALSLEDQRRVIAEELARLEAEHLRISVQTPKQTLEKGSDAYRQQTELEEKIASLQKAFLDLDSKVKKAAKSKVSETDESQ